MCQHYIMEKRWPFLVPVLAQPYAGSCWEVKHLAGILWLGKAKRINLTAILFQEHNFLKQEGSYATDCPVIYSYNSSEWMCVLQMSCDAYLYIAFSEDG